ncbi:GIY-YIG nuclease family protein [Flavobacterium plurextorum]|uniref:GIY-YIG nuclease family protein n=1 Tax=Flavobacterium TaxID=237 RepID=UPI00214DB0F9|nr:MULTISPECIES: GIY-YIG nuclease family protein [Flavobacterium]UUW07675.1 GIY-YIG nuclease family protein [Flavobacterium plurextorum]
METEQYLENLKKTILSKNNFKKVIMTREWASKIPSSAGVYVFKDVENIVYVGETGNLRGRMKDLLDSRHHTVRRTIGERFYCSIPGFQKATNKIKFPDNIEFLVNDHICTKLSLAYLEVKLGRKELEEEIHCMMDIAVRLNKRGKRK